MDLPSFIDPKIFWMGVELLLIGLLLYKRVRKLNRQIRDWHQSLMSTKQPVSRSTAQEMNLNFLTREALEITTMFILSAGGVMIFFSIAS